MKALPKKEVKTAETNKKVKKSLKYSIIDGSAYSVMAGFGDEYISPFAIAMRATNAQIGLLSSIPNLVAALAQLISSRLIRFASSRKKIINTGVFFHALFWLPILLLPFIIPGYYGIFALITIISVRALFGAIAGPPWGSLMSDLVPKDKRGAYFGVRNEIVSIVLLVSIFLAGFFLHLFPKNKIFIAFTILFFIAMTFRFISLYFLNKMYEPPFKFDEKEYFSFSKFIRNAWYNNFGKFAIFLAAFSFAVGIASPFFTVFMLRDLGLSYLAFTIIRVGSTLVSLIAMPLWGRLSDKIGNVKVVKITGILIPLIPLLWLFPLNVPYLLFVEAFSGFLWAGFGLASFNFVFDAVTPHKRPFCLAYNNLMSGTATVVGTLLGSFLATYIKNPLIFFSVLQILFLTSGILRFLTFFILATKIKEVRPRVVKETPKEIILDLIPLKPVRGLAYQIITLVEKTTKDAKDGLDGFEHKVKDLFLKKKK